MHFLCEYQLPVLTSGLYLSVGDVCEVPWTAYNKSCILLKKGGKCSMVQKPIGKLYIIYLRMVFVPICASGKVCLRANLFDLITSRMHLANFRPYIYVLLSLFVEIKVSYSYYISSTVDSLVDGSDNLLNTYLTAWTRDNNTLNNEYIMNYTHRARVYICYKDDGSMPPLCLSTKSMPWQDQMNWNSRFCPAEEPWLVLDARKPIKTNINKLKQL